MTNDMLKMTNFHFSCGILKFHFGPEQQQFFLGPITFSGCQVISQLLTIKKIKLKKITNTYLQPIKKCAQLRTLGTPMQKAYDFCLFNTDTNTVTNMNSGTDMDTGTVTETSMATSTASDTTTDTDMAMNTATHDNGHGD